MRSAEQYRRTSETYLQQSREVLTPDAVYHLQRLAEVYARLAHAAEAAMEDNASARKSDVK
jgi:hypothetical protein